MRQHDFSDEVDQRKLGFVWFQLPRLLKRRRALRRRKPPGQRNHGAKENRGDGRGRLPRVDRPNRQLGTEPAAETLDERGFPGRLRTYESDDDSTVVEDQVLLLPNDPVEQERADGESGPDAPLQGAVSLVVSQRTSEPPREPDTLNEIV